MAKKKVRKFSGQDESFVRSVFPAQIRTFVSTLTGNRDPITEKDFTEAELKQARDAIMQSRERQMKSQGNISSQSVAYQDYPRDGGRSQKSIMRDYGVGQGDAMRNTLGRFSYEKTPEGRLIAKDNYDFEDDLAKEIPGIRRTADYEAMNPLEKVGALVKDTVADGKRGIGTLPSRVGNAFIGRQGRPVRVDLGEAPFKKGGAVKSKPAKASKSRGDGLAQRGKTRGKMR